MFDAIFDKMMAHLQLKGASDFTVLQKSLQVHPSNLFTTLDAARMQGLVRKVEDGSGYSWQLTDEGRKYCNLRAVASKEENRPKEEAVQFIVLGPNNHNSGSYKSFYGAEVQARNLASKSPGKTYRIVKVVAEVFCEGPQVRKF